MNRNIVTIICLMVTIGLSGCSVNSSKTASQKTQLSAEEKQRRDTCRSLYPEAKAKIESKSAYPVTLLDPKNFLQGKPLDKWFNISAYIGGQFGDDCPQKMEDVKVLYALGQGPDFQIGYYLKFVDADGTWDNLTEGVNARASTTRTLSDEPPQLTMTIDSLPVSSVYPERTVSDDNVAVTVHRSIHANYPKVIYTVSNVGHNFVTLKGISITSGSFVVDEVYRQPQTLPPGKEFRELKLKRANRMSGLEMNIRSPRELEREYKMSVSVAYEVNGVGHTLFREFSVPLRELVKRRKPFK